MSKHNEAERLADQKRARHEAQAQRNIEHVQLTPEEIRQRAIIHRNLVERRQMIRRQRQAQEHREQNKHFNCLGDLFPKAVMGDFA